MPERYFTEFVRPLVRRETPLSVAEADKYLLIGSWGSQFTFDVPFGPGLYGLHWWFNGLVGQTSQRHWPDAPLDTFAAIGNYPARAIIVIPSLGLVVAGDANWSGGSDDTRPLAGSRGQPHRYWSPGDPAGPFNTLLKLLVAAVQ